MEKVKVGQVRFFEGSIYTIIDISYDTLTATEWVKVIWHPDFEGNYPVSVVEEDRVLSPLELELL